MPRANENMKKRDERRRRMRGGELAMAAPVAGLRSDEIETANAAFTFALWLNDGVDKLAGGTVEVWAGWLKQRGGDASARRRRSSWWRKGSLYTSASARRGKCEG
jgi:hypothetical protein